MVEEVKERNEKVWEPHPRQVEFLSLPSYGEGKVFEAMYGGAAAGGKSEVLLMLPIAKQWIRNPKFHGIIFRRTFPQLEESLIPRSHEYYPHFGGKYNASNHSWHFPNPDTGKNNGAIIRFGYMEQDKDAKAHDTAEYHYVGFDELTHFSEIQYRYLTSRIRTTDPSLPAIIRSATNPGGVGHAWVRDRFVKPCPTGGKILLDPLSKTKRIFIPAKLTDNPSIMKVNPDYFNQLRLLPEAERRAKMEGDWWSFSGQVFTELRIVPNSFESVDGKPAPCHVVEPFSIPSYWPKILFIDWGYAAMTYAGWIAIAPDGRVFLYREYVARQTPIAVWGSDIRRYSNIDENLVSIVIDPSANQNRGEMTVKQQFLNASGFDYVEDGENARIDGKLLVHEYLRWSEKPKRYVPPEGFVQETYDRIFRLHGVKMADEYRSLFEPEPAETNLPKLQIFNTCGEIINALSNCIYHETRVEDVAEFPGDDPYDALRYGLSRVNRYLHDTKAFEEQSKLGKIVQRLQMTGDMTTFYHQMEAHERETNSNVVSIHRFGSRRGRYKRAHI